MAHVPSSAILAPVRLLLEILFFIITVGVLPVVINKSTEVHLDWVRRYLRELWFGIFVFFFAYWIFTKPEITEEAVRLHKNLTGSLGYGVAALFGATLCCGFWWFTGRVLSSPVVVPSSVSLQPASPVSHQAITMVTEGTNTEPAPATKTPSAAAERSTHRSAPQRVPRFLPESSEPFKEFDNDQLIALGKLRVEEFDGPLQEWEHGRRIMPPTAYIQAFQLYRHSGKEFFMFQELYTQEASRRLGRFNDMQWPKSSLDLEKMDRDQFVETFSFRSHMAVLGMKRMINRLCRADNKANIYVGVPE